MELKKEKSFPRGGRKPALFKSNNNSFFPFLKKSKGKATKKIKKVKQSEKKDLSEQPVAKAVNEGYSVKYVDDLKPSILQEGMLLLGIISKVMERIVTVSLPGGLRGAIHPANISEHYRSIVENISESSEVPSLSEIFHVGDVLPVKILSVSTEHHSLTLTCDPKIINEKLSHNVIEKGFILTGSVKSQEDHGFIIDFGIEHLNGFLNYNKVNENQILIVGQLVRCCIIQSNASVGSCNVQLSLLKKDFQSAFIKKNSTLPIFCFIPGLQFEVIVKKTLLEGVEVSCGDGESKGFIHEDHLVRKFSNPDDLECGSKVIATLLYIKPLVNFLYFKVMPKKEIEWPFKYGEIVSGKVAKVRRTGVIFKINEGSKKAKCFVPVSKLQNKLELQDKSEILNLYPLNKKVAKIRLGNVDFMGRYYVGATDRASIMEKYYSVTDLKCGEIVPCTIVSFGKTSACLEIGRAIKGVVGLTDMTDVPLKNPMSKFKLGQKIKARVVEIIPEKLLVRVTMKPTLLKEKEILCDFQNYKKSSSYVGTVYRIMHNKIIIKFFNHIFGVVPKHLTPYPESESLTNHFYIGQLVKCTVVGVQGQNSLYLSLFSVNANVQLEIGKKHKDIVVNKTDKVLVDGSTKCKVPNDERIELSSSSESEDEEEHKKKMENSKAFEVGFNWEVLNNQSLLSGVLANKDEPSSEDEDDESKYEKKKRRRLTGIEKKEKAKSEEERLRYIEERLMDTEREPENADDFDRAVLAEPNSSALWLKYMAFHIQETEIEKARAVARRALKVISFREEQEKLNIWIALLNLENMYGTEESLNKTLSEALQVNEPYRIHLHMLNVHGQGNRFQEMEKLGNFMLKKYKETENMWYDVGAAYFSVGKIESARNVLQKALTIVDKNKHVPLISKFAQLENKHGNPERAQTLYESILSSFPKRVDIWCCYVDMLVKSNYIDLARQVLERATSQSLRPRKMKTLFKKFIAFEEAHGKPEDLEKVREAAVEYVQTVGGLDD